MLLNIPLIDNKNLFDLKQKAQVSFLKILQQSWSMSIDSHNLGLEIDIASIRNKQTLKFNVQAKVVLEVSLLYSHFSTEIFRCVIVLSTPKIK